MPILTERYTLAQVKSALLGKQDWKPFPKASDRDTWTALLAHGIHQRRADYLLGRAEILAKTPLPALTATEYMRFVRTGDRTLYEGPYFERRNTLATLALAECFSGQRRFLDAVINTTWAITEEATWCLPAHAKRDEQGALHTQDQHTVDLFAAETGMVLAEVIYLVGEGLLPEAKAVLDRVRNQLIERIIEPVETQECGWYTGRNNWSPWCASNVTGIAMYTLEDPDRLAAMVYKMMGVCDAFIDKYADDGGCDEGPTYWSVAPGALLTFLELLYSRSDGKLSIYDMPKLKRMVEYMAHAYMGRGRGLNFADAQPRIYMRPYLLYRFGERVGVPVGKELAGLSMRGNVENGPVTQFINGEPNGAGATARLRELFWVPPEVPAGKVRCQTTAWLENLQVLIARQSPEPEKGITFAIKGGHNQENHNHNDLGHFVVYVDGHPGIIDVGVESYTKKTFSSERYTIWCIRGSGHNAAVMGDTEQVNGREHAAHEVKLLTPDAQTTGLSMRLEKAYPATAGLAAYTREGMLHRAANTVSVRDTIVFADAAKTPKWTFYTLEKPVAIDSVTMRIPVGARTLQMSLSQGRLAPVIESVPLTDAWLKNGWGATIYRITLHGAGVVKEAEYGFDFRVL
jgi:hypothetical protein